MSEQHDRAGREADEKQIAAAMARMEARAATNPIARWFLRSTGRYWGFATRVATYFPLALGRVKGGNPLLGLLRLALITIAGFAIVPPLYLVIGPFVQLGIMLITIAWSFLAAIFGWHRPTPEELAQLVAVEEKKDKQDSFPA